MKSLPSAPSTNTLEASKGGYFNGGARRNNAGEGDHADHAVAKLAAIVENSDFSANADASTRTETTKERVVFTFRTGTAAAKGSVGHAELSYRRHGRRYSITG